MLIRMIKNYTIQCINYTRYKGEVLDIGEGETQINGAHWLISKGYAERYTET